MLAQARPLMINHLTSKILVWRLLVLTWLSLPSHLFSSYGASVAGYIPSSKWWGPHETTPFSSSSPSRRSSSTQTSIRPPRKAVCVCSQEILVWEYGRGTTRKITLWQFCAIRFASKDPFCYKHRKNGFSRKPAILATPSIQWNWS